MAGKVMGWVFKVEADLKPEDLLVLLAYADHAHPDGTHIFPGVKLIAEKTRHSDRSVQRTTRRLVDLGLLVPDGKGPHGTNMWRIPVPWKGDTDGDIHDTIGPREMVTPEAAMVTPVTSNGDTAMSPEPLVTVKEPSALVKRPAQRAGRALQSHDGKEQEHVGSTSALTPEGTPTNPAELVQWLRTFLLTPKEGPLDPAELTQWLKSEYAILSTIQVYPPDEQEWSMARNDDLRWALKQGGMEALQMVDKMYQGSYPKRPDRATLRANVGQLFSRSTTEGQF